MEKNLQALLRLLPEAEVTGSADKTITDITADSRVVVPGSLFICLKRRFPRCGAGQFVYLPERRNG